MLARVLVLPRQCWPHDAELSESCASWWAWTSDATEGAPTSHSFRKQEMIIIRMEGMDMSYLKCCCLLLIVGTMLLWAAPASANVTIANGNAEVWIDSTSPLGTFNWTMDGATQLFQQWWWFRLGDSGVAQSIDTLTRSSLIAVNNIYHETFTLDGKFSIELTYVLSGGVTNSGTSDLAEIINVTKLDGADTLYLFQYSDFDLDEDGMADTVLRANENTWHQYSGSGLTFSETVATPAPTAFEAGLFNDTVLNLEGIDGYQLNNVAGPLTGDVSWAWQWDINGTGSYIISKDKHLMAVPAPGAAVLGFVGIWLVGWVKRRLA